MRFWIDIEDSSGTRQGAGPIASAPEWENVVRLSKAGRFRFGMAATDPRSALAQLKQVARCRSTVNGAVVDIGAGVIDEIAKLVERESLRVSGDDRLRELVNRHVGDLLISDGADGPDTDGPSVIMALAPSGWSLDTTEGFNATIKSIYHQYDGETVLAALVRLSELTGEHFRLGAGKSVIWMRRTGSAKVAHSGITNGPFTMGETVTGGTSGASGSIQEATGGAGAGYLYIEEVSGSFVSGETITGGSSGAYCTAGNCYNPSSGIRAVAGGDPVAMESNTDVCLITDLEEVEDGYDGLIGRVYAVGSGMGGAKLELNGVSISPPSGYALGSVAGKGYHLQHTTTWNSYGIERRETFKDVQDVDELYHQAYEYLSRAKNANKAYRLRVAGLRQTLNVGKSIRVIFQRWVDGFHAVDIDTDLVVLEATNRIDEEGLRTVGLVVATVDRWPEGDSGALVTGLQQSGNLQVHTQKVLGDDVVGVVEGAAPDDAQYVVMALDPDLTAEVLLSQNAVTRLVKGAELDLNLTSKQSLYTVPSGKVAFILHVVIRSYVGSGACSASFGFGFNANADDVVAAAAHTELVDETVYTMVDAKAGAAMGSASAVFGMKVTVTQSEAVVAVDVMGYLV